MPRVTFTSRGIDGPCRAGETVLDAVRELGYIIDHACGGNARCGTCCVRVLRGSENLSSVGGDEAAQLAELGLREPFRLSCQARIRRGTVVVTAGY